MSETIQEIEERLLSRISALEGRVGMMENNVEEIFFATLSMKTSRKSVELIIEMAVIEHFKSSRKGFHTTHMGAYGDKSTISIEDRLIILARKWFMVIMHNMLHHTSYSMEKNYTFYHHKKEKEHRPIYLAALHPVSEGDMIFRKTLMDIFTIVKRICNEEGLFDERLDII